MTAAVKARNGKTVLRDFMVTFTVTHYAEVRAHDSDEAGVRAARLAGDRWGHGRIAVTEVEEVE